MSSFSENNSSKICNRILIFCTAILFTFVSCVDCDKWEDNLAKDECILVVLQKPNIKDNFFNFKGIDPVTGRQCDCKSKTSYRWWDIYADKIDVGDTIIKRRGELVFNIHKQDEVLSFNWECNGKVYK